MKRLTPSTLESAD